MLTMRLIHQCGFHNPSNQGELFMKLRRGLVALTIAIVLIVMSAAQRAQTNPKGKLEGAWNAVLTADEGGFQEAERYTFATGPSVDEGSLVFSNEVDAVPPCGTDQGVWVRTGSRQFTLTHGAFCVDLSTGAPAFRIKFRETITLNARDDQFTGRGIFEVLDLSGGLLFSATYSVRGTRMRAESPFSTLGLDEADAAFQGGHPVGGEDSPWRRWRQLIRR
jgi:hypothetical protein